MTAFDLFQQATCEIADGDRAAAVTTIDAALAQIDRDGVDADVAPDLRVLRAMLAAKC